MNVKIKLICTIKNNNIHSEIHQTIFWCLIIIFIVPTNEFDDHCKGRTIFYTTITVDI